MAKHLEPILGSPLFGQFAPKRVGVKGWDIPLETPAKVIRNENGVGYSIVADNLRMNLEVESMFYSDESLDGEVVEVVFEGNLKEAYNFAADFYPNKVRKMA